MKTASIHELKNELSNVPANELLELCLRLAKFKKENKELLTFLLFEAHDLESYISVVKAYMDEEFISLPATLYLVKKVLRKILRTVNKYIKYSGDKQVETELLIYFCSKVKQAHIALDKSTVLNNLFEQQLKKIDKAINSMHEDLQYDFRRLLKASV
ncbi:hypothetical protein SAMN05421788_102219 [Filimonas lacunae]|uniref:Uncharacterized protein n=1 Tax=Filimonas lacunae TaxID=477680 RepID=A0A173MHT0_9BACT|nr:hypothetical protein [Filimonas lacunae]BAV07155.1 hypothetical protein FLA_3178 [Filimonas lacunae]SIS94180.1 hypothetical protein SAMN05421788_102219 [Filimonas lacunae]